MNIKAIGTALKNKVTSAAGAPGRAAYNKFVKPHDDLKMKRADEKYAFLKDYQAKRKSGAPITNMEQAKYQTLKDRK